MKMWGHELQSKIHDKSWWKYFYEKPELTFDTINSIKIKSSEMWEPNLLIMNFYYGNEWIRRCIYRCYLEFTTRTFLNRIVQGESEWIAKFFQTCCTNHSL